jgi:Mg-chelatase subunit ChlD
MLTFKQAKRRHSMVADIITSANEPLAVEIYAGVTGLGAVGNAVVTLAVADTMPVEYAVLLATEDIAAAFALQCHIEAHAAAGMPPRYPGSPYEARKIADDGWERFRRIADQGGYVDHGLGADRTGGWPVLKTVQELQPDPEKMRRIALLAGRMYAALKGAKAQRVAGIPEEVIGTETGGDVAALLPQEYAMLGTDPTRRHLFSQIAQRRALQFERAGRDKKARGPLVIALDESGSMHGGRDEWAKAAMTALTRIAWEEKRAVVVVHFSTATKAVVLKPGDKAGVVRAQHTFLDGGTDIGRALMVGVDEVANLAALGHRGADVVLVSDGGDAGSRIGEALEEMRKAGTRLWSIAIDTPFRGDLKERASEYIHLTDADMTSVDGAKKLGGSVL